jgi:hypothetical protein
MIILFYSVLLLVATKEKKIFAIRKVLTSEVLNQSVELLIFYEINVSIEQSLIALINKISTQFNMMP